MKYLSVFEKFESEKLSKVLGYISKSDKNLFLNELRSICKCEDIEMSKLSDDMFTYLPYRSGIKVKSKVEKVNCPECTEGKIKKPWGIEGQKGFHYRYLPCKRCGGDGKIEPHQGQISDIKFWFNTEKKYLGKSCINGLEKKVDTLFHLYDEIKPLNHHELMSLETGTKVRIFIGYDVVSTIFKDPINHRTYAIQNTRNSSYPPQTPEWKKYGTCSWRIDNMEYRNAKLLNQKKSEILEDPLDWNFDVSIGRSILTSMNSVKEIVKDAEFCLILNLDKLKNLKKFPKSEISLKRKERIGIKKTNDEIKNENIKRYILKLSDSFKLSNEIGDVSKIIPRLFGWSYSSFFIFRELNFSTLDRITNSYFDLFKQINASEEDIKYYEDVIKQYLKEGYQKSSESYQLTTQAIKNLESECTEDSLEFINLFKELGSTINEKILKTKIETLGDFELVSYKINNIRSILYSGRYSIRYFEYCLKRIHLNYQDMKQNLDHYKEQTKQSNKDLKNIIQSVNKM